MNKNTVLFISMLNFEFTDDLISTVRSLMVDIGSVGKGITVFKEDASLFSVYKGLDIVSAISCLNSKGDQIVFSKNNDAYSTVCRSSINKSNIDVSDLAKRSLTRYPMIKRENVYDEDEFNSRRLGITINRIKYVVSNSLTLFPFIVNITGKREDSLARTLTPKRGDGMFIYEINIITNKTSLHVGGVPVNPNMFIQCIRGS